MSRSLAARAFVSAVFLTFGSVSCLALSSAESAFSTSCSYLKQFSQQARAATL
jgi:hypothetical protein